MKEIKSKKELNKEDLILYELPFWCEFVSNEYFQKLVSRYVAYKVNKKHKRYTSRLFWRKFYSLDKTKKQ